MKYLKYVILIVAIIAILTGITLSLKKKANKPSNSSNENEVSIDVESKYNNSVSDNLTRVTCYKNTDIIDSKERVKFLKKIEYHLGYDKNKQYEPVEEEYYQYYLVYPSIEDYENAKNIDWEKEDGNFEFFDDKLVIIKTFIIRDKDSFLNTASEEELKKYMEEHELFDTVTPYKTKYDSLIEKGYKCN